MKALAVALMFLIACGSSKPATTTAPPANAQPPEQTCCCLFADGAKETAINACAAQRGTCDTEMTECYSLGPTP